MTEITLRQSWSLSVYCVNMTYIAGGVMVPLIDHGIFVGSIPNTFQRHNREVMAEPRGVENVISSSPEFSLQLSNESKSPYNRSKRSLQFAPSEGNFVHSQQKVFVHYFVVVVADDR